MLGGSMSAGHAALCGRALPEAGRQRVAELHGAASDTNHCVSFALRISGPKRCCPPRAEELPGILLTCHTSSWHEL